jgi:GTP pyrophosphokinase
MVQVTGEFEDVTEQPLDFDGWVGRLPIVLGDAERERLARGWAMAERACAGRQRDSGESYFHHAVAVATIVGGLRLDTDTLIAALLHDLPWFDAFDAGRVSGAFGEDVANLVDGTARMGRVSELHRRPDLAENQAERSEALRKMLLAMARDIRVVFIVLAERLHDIRMLKFRPEPVHVAVARETLDLYAPLANRLGIWQLKWELEDLSFRFLEPATYKRIAKLLAEKRVDRERFINDMQERLREELGKAGIDADVSGRPKHIYSIWRKMQRKGLGFHELYDIRAFRLLVDTVPQCYAALGVAHALWQPIPREFDDYIASPKENNYQSLHTAVVGPEGNTVEIQIRTRDMHQQAELGIAAHWRYKEGRPSDAAFDRKVAWLRQLLESGGDNDGEAEEDLIDRFKAEVFEDRVYVITPRGDVKDLPRGATPLDFAYQVHSQIGHRCRGARVNGRIVPLTYTLQNGDQVEILTGREARPSRDWLNPGLGYIHTPRARGKARAWFRQQDFDQNAADGRVTLERELHRLGLSDINLEKLAGRSRFPKVEDFLAAIGRGDVTGNQIAGLLSDELLPGPEPPALPLRRPRDGHSGAPADAITIYGVGNLLTRLAGCCQPAAGDPIIGFITRGEGVTIHRRDCANVDRFEQEAPSRLIEVSWNRQTDRKYPVNIQIEAYDRQGLIKDITALLSNEKINVIAVNTRTDPQDQRARMTLTLEVADVNQMSRAIDRIASLRNVRDVRRVASA